MSVNSTQIDSSAIASRIAMVRSRIESACLRAGRSPEEVTLVGVSKTFPLDAVRAAHGAGIVHFGENKPQELKSKASVFPGLRNGGPIVWHMIGHLQRNKAKEVAAHADLFHALDGVRLAETLDRRCALIGRVLPCLVQVNVSGEASKAGIAPQETGAFLDSLKSFEHLKIVGLMTLAAPAPDPEQIRPQFRKLNKLASDHSHASQPLDILSMGMSGDFEVAIEEGATHVRVGSAIFGARTYLQNVTNGG